MKQDHNNPRKQVFLSGCVRRVFRTADPDLSLRDSLSGCKRSRSREPPSIVGCDHWHVGPADCLLRVMVLAASSLYRTNTVSVLKLCVTPLPSSVFYRAAELFTGKVIRDLHVLSNICVAFSWLVFFRSGHLICSNKLFICLCFKSILLGCSMSDWITVPFCVLTFCVHLMHDLKPNVCSPK